MLALCAFAKEAYARIDAQFIDFERLYEFQFFRCKLT
jgi:hypothetical protein